MRDHHPTGRRIRVLLFVALATSTPVPASSYEDAVAAFRAGKYGTAAAMFEALVEQSPQWAAGRVVLGQCYYLLDRPDEAAAAIERAREIDPETDLFEAYSGAGQLLFDQKRFKQAVAPLLRALEHAPDTMRSATRLRLAFAQVRAQEFDAARTTLTRQEQAAGRSRESAYYLALACRGAGDYDCALEALRAAREFGDDGGKLAGQLGRWSHYWALLPTNEERRDVLLADAVEDTRTWMESSPGDPDSVDHHADVLLAAGRPRNLVQLLLPLAAREPHDCRLRVQLARAYATGGDSAEAERWAGEATTCDAGLADAWVELAAASIRRLRPDYGSTDEVREDRRRLEVAVKALQRAIELDPKRTGRLDGMLADARTALEQRIEAENEFARADVAWTKHVESERLLEIRRRCEAILWKRRTGQALTPEETTHFSEHDCRRFESAAD